MGNVFMRKTEDVFQEALKIKKKNDFKKKFGFFGCGFSWGNNK